MPVSSEKIKGSLSSDFLLKRLDASEVGCHVELAVQSGCTHVADFAENRALFPGPVVKSEQPGHVGIGVGVAAVDKIFVVRKWTRFGTLAKIRDRNQAFTMKGDLCQRRS